MNTHGAGYWRSLEERAANEEFLEGSLHREFPPLASEWDDGVSRREFLRIMAASMALAGLGACTRQPLETIVPYVRQPEQLVPGKPLFYATAMTLGGFATGLLVETHEGRPTKIEGNEKHPASLGATDAFAQASILTLYDPDRAQTVRHEGRISTWENFLGALSDALNNRNVKLRILTETITSPTLASQLRAVLQKFPTARWHQYEPVTRDNLREGARLSFGEVVNTGYHFDRASVVLAVDSNFLMNPRYARDFIQARRERGVKLYCVECMPTITGAVADKRIPMRAGEIAGFLRNLPGEIRPDLVIVGERQPPAVHALAHAMNRGDTVTYTQPVEAEPMNQIGSLRSLIADMNAGEVDLLVIIEANPVFTAPADLRFADAMNKVRLRAQLSLYEDETSELCHWHLPEAHYLETWSDTRAFDGTVTITQPMIAPLYGGKSAHELLAAILGQPGKTSHDIVREFWKMSDERWNVALQDGVVAGSALPEKRVTLKRRDFPVEKSVGSLEVNFDTDPTIWDGRFANNGWLQESPKPLTKLTWDNAAHMSAATAQRLGIESGDVVELQLPGRSIRAPVWITPGHADDSVTVHFGYGRRRAGRVGTGTGFDAYRLRTSDALWFASGLEIRKTKDRVRLATTQTHQNMEGRDLVRVVRRGEETEHEREHGMSLYLPHKYEGYAWGMVIDQSACVGCNACVVACQAENNIPTVGKTQVLRGREMHWLRIDTYFAGSLENPATHFQPVLCMHCENAPCEVVCPVAATTHSSEGLNEMTYNRCVGTRYCSNNCPYKVRRFNFLQYADLKTESLKLQRNPNVTVRTRGVMEKCTYCVQRINAARVRAKIENRTIRDGEVVTACQAACPTEAIVFGDINDPNSRVAKLKASPLNYGLLTDLNTRPRTTYLAKVVDTP
jgi:molybdopterin-containing oxidoreductase family iron-sulfur binding subunit